MIELWIFWMLALGALGAIGGLCWQLSRIYMECSILNQCISDMLLQPDDAERTALDARAELIRRGLVKER